MDKLRTIFFKAFYIFQEPASKHGRKHTVCLWVTCLFSENIQIPAIYEFYIFLCTGVQIVNVWCNRITIFIYTADSTNDTIAHDGLNLCDIKPFFFHLGCTFFHPFDGEGEVFVNVHAYPAWFWIG